MTEAPGDVCLLLAAPSRAPLPRRGADASPRCRCFSAPPRQPGLVCAATKAHARGPARAVARDSAPLLAGEVWTPPPVVVPPFGLAEAEAKRERAPANRAAGRAEAALGRGASLAVRPSLHQKTWGGSEQPSSRARTQGTEALAA